MDQPLNFEMPATSKRRVVFSALLFLLVLVPIVILAGSRHPIVWPLGLLMAGGAIAVAHRVCRLGVTVNDGELAVRNTFGTRTMAKSDILLFRLGGPGRNRLFVLPLSRTVHVILANNEDVVVELFLYTYGRERAALLVDGIRELRHWLAS